MRELGTFPAGGAILAGWSMPDLGASGGGRDSIPDRDVDLLKTNIARRKLMTFGPRNEAMRKSLNKELSGGESYPLLTTTLGLRAGFFSATVGFLWTGFTTALTLAQEPQAVRARTGDEVHQVEAVGVRNGRIEWMELLVLVDPFREVANQQDGRQWILHETRDWVHVD